MRAGLQATRATMGLTRVIRGATRTFGVDLVRYPQSDRGLAEWSRSHPAQHADVAIVGPYITHNFGDDLIGSVFASYLKARRSLSSTIAGLSLENSIWLGTVPEISVARSVRASGSLLIGGGNIFGDRGPNQSNIYLWRAAKAAIYARTLGKPIMVSGVGGGPLGARSARMLCRLITGLASRVGVRDIETRDFLVAEIGVSPDKIVTGSDVALLWPDLLPVVPVKNGRVGVQCDLDGYAARSGPEQERVVYGEIDRFARDNLDVLAFFSNSRTDTGVLRISEPLCVSVRYASLGKFLPHLAGLKAIVTSHLHLAIAAFAARVPCFTIYVHDKTRRFYSQIGREDRAMSLEDATPDSIRALLESALVAVWTDADEERLGAAKEGARRLLGIIGDG